MIRAVKNWVATLRNAVDYPLRRRLVWRRQVRPPRNEPKDGLFKALPEPERSEARSTEARLRGDYRLDSLYRASTRQNYRENLFYLEILENAFARADYQPPDPVTVGDVGPSHWFYARALYQLLRWWETPRGRVVALHGFEIDPYRVYADFYSRMDHALAQIQGLEGVVYHPEGIHDLRSPFDLILQLFPFVFLEDHLDWGLPRRLFNPAFLSRQVYDRLHPGGTLVVINQGQAEHEEQRRILQEARFNVVSSFRHDSLLFAYDLPRFVLVGRKDEDGS